MAMLSAGHKHQKHPSLFILLLLVSFGMVSAVLFTPGLPQIAQQLAISEKAAELAMTVFLVGYAFGFLPYGPLSDRFGRKKTAYLGISIAILGCLMILLVKQFPSFTLLLMGRLLLALGSSVGLKIAYTIIGDVYKDDKATKIISYMMMAFAIAPALAIGLGGVLTTYYGWESCFYFQTGYSVLLLILTFYLPETSPTLDQEGLKTRAIYRGYLEKIKDRKLLYCGLLTGCGASLYYLFAAESPFIGIVKLELSPEAFGLYSFIPPIGLFLGALFANLLVGKKTPLTILFFGTLLAFLLSVLMFLLFLFDAVTPWTLFLPMPLMYIGESLVYANASSLVLTHARNKSYASATLNFLTIGLCAVSLSIFGSLPPHQPLLMPLFFTGTTLIMLLLLLGLRRTLQMK